MSVYLHQERKENQIKSREEKVFRPRDFFYNQMIIKYLGFLSFSPTKQDIKYPFYTLTI